MELMDVIRYLILTWKLPPQVDLTLEFQPLRLYLPSHDTTCRSFFKNPFHHVYLFVIPGGIYIWQSMFAK